MFNMTPYAPKGSKAAQKEAGIDDNWHQDQELFRQKLEKTAIQKFKSKIAQQNKMADRGGGGQSKHVAMDPDMFSDNDLANGLDDIQHGSSTAVVANQVKLTP